MTRIVEAVGTFLQQLELVDPEPEFGGGEARSRFAQVSGLLGAGEGARGAADRAVTLRLDGATGAVAWRSDEARRVRMTFGCEIGYVARGGESLATLSVRMAGDFERIAFWVSGAGLAEAMGVERIELTGARFTVEPTRERIVLELALSMEYELTEAMG